MGGNGGVLADECADIYISYTPGGFDIYGDGEYYCQGPDDYARCDAMSVDEVLSTDPAGGQYGHPGGDYTCSGSSCPTGRALVATYHYSASMVVTSGECIPNGVGVYLTPNSITVPDGTKVTYPEVPGTGIRICFN
jgi:hypothetical protein